jgi:hypothetical protein
MRTRTTMTLAITMTLASSCSSCSSCSSRDCVQAMDAYARATQAAPHDEDDHAYDDFVAIAARTPKDGDGTCRAVAALSTQVANVRAERAAARSAARQTAAPRPAPKAAPQAQEDAAADDKNADAGRTDAGSIASGDDDEHEHATATATATAAAAVDDDDDDDRDEERPSQHAFAVASSPNAVVAPVNVSRAVARAQASSSLYACAARCTDDQQSCLGRCDKAWKAGRSVGEYRDCQIRCSDVEVRCRRKCAPRRHPADGGPE